MMIVMKIMKREWRRSDNENMKNNEENWKKW